MVSVSALISKCKACAVALGNYESSANLFSVQSDSELLKSVEATLKLGRLTIIEYNLLDALVTEETDHGEAKKLIEKQVDTFEVGGVRPYLDLQKSLWSLAQGVSKDRKILRAPAQTTIVTSLQNALVASTSAAGSAGA